MKVQHQDCSWKNTGSFKCSLSPSMALSTLKTTNTLVWLWMVTANRGSLLPLLGIPCHKVSISNNKVSFKVL